MNAHAAFVAVAVGTSLIGACGQHPISPTSVAPLLGSSSGPSQNPMLAQLTSTNPKTLTDHALPPDFSESAFNPCTGSPTTLTFHFLKFVESGESAGERYTSTAVFEVSTSDGFTGRGIAHHGGVKNPGNSGIEIDTEVVAQTADNGTGQRVVAHFVMQFVRQDGIPLVQFQKISLECVGKPA